MKKAAANRDYPLVVISDLHLGMKNGARDKLREFLKNLSCDTLVLNGDIVDGERLDRYPTRKLTEGDVQVIDAINDLIAKGTKVVYIPGNHDEALREIDVYGKTFNGITFAESYVHTTPQEKKFFIFHGDQLFKRAFPAMPRVINPDDPLHEKALAHVINTARSIFDQEKSIYAGTLVDRASQSVLGEQFNAANKARDAYRYINKFRSDFRRGKKKFARDLLHPVAYLKGASNTLRNAGGMKKAALAKARHEGFDGIICGHSHRPEVSVAPDGIIYANSGDWVNSFTALALNKKGEWELIQDKSGFPGKSNDNKQPHKETKDMVEAIHKIWPLPARRPKP